MISDITTFNWLLYTHWFKTVEDKKATNKQDKTNELEIIEIEDDPTKETKIAAGKVVKN